MNYLKPPASKPDMLSAKVPGHDQVNISSDGLFHVESIHLAAALIAQLGLEPVNQESFAAAITSEDAPAEDETETEDPVEEDETEDEDPVEEEEDEEEEPGPVENWGKSELKAWLDENEIEYGAKDKKDVLLELVQENMEDEE